MEKAQIKVNSQGIAPRYIVRDANLLPMNQNKIPTEFNRFN